MAGRRRGSYSQAARLLLLLEHLRSRRYGVTLGELATKFDVTERQMRRDLDALREAGYETELVAGPDGPPRARLAGPPIKPVMLTAREKYALLAVRSVFDVLEDTPLHEDVRSIYAKMAASLPPDEQRELARFSDRFVYLPDGGTKTYKGKDDVLDGLLTGVMRRQHVRGHYVPASGEGHDRVLAPYALVLYKHGLYAIACSVDSEGALVAADAPHVYAAERFTSAEHIRGTSFEVPKSFTLETFFQGAFGLFQGSRSHHVVVDFGAELRSLIEARIWHKTQKLTPMRNGGIRLEMDIASLAEVHTWVLSWGPYAKVKRPAELVDWVRREARATAKMYSRAK